MMFDLCGILTDVFEHVRIKPQMTNLEDAPGADGPVLEAPGRVGEGSMFNRRAEVCDFGAASRLETSH